MKTSKTPLALSRLVADRVSGTESDRVSGTESNRVSGTESDRVSGMESNRVSGMESDRVSGTESSWDPSTSRRNLLLTGLLAGVGGAIGLRSLPSAAQSNADIAILNAAIDLEQQAIWAYKTAAGKLSSTEVGKMVLDVATKSLKDHEQHRDLLVGAVRQLGGTPSPARDSYDLSTYIDDKEGNLDSDANIAKLALALEFDAALAYNDAFIQLSNKDLVAAASTIGPNEIAHATAIRAVFNSLDSSILVVPSPFVSADTRERWILKV